MKRGVKRESHNFYRPHTKVQWNSGKKESWEKVMLTGNNNSSKGRRRRQRRRGRRRRGVGEGRRRRCETERHEVIGNKALPLDFK